MEIMLIAVVLALVFGQKTTHRRVRGRKLTDEVPGSLLFGLGLWL
jgi:hypothetical protein